MVFPYTKNIKNFMGVLPKDTQTYRMGQCFILLIPPDKQYLTRMVIACKERYPLIEEVIHAWHSLIPLSNNGVAVMGIPTLQQFNDPKNFALTIQEIQVAKG